MVNRKRRQVRRRRRGRRFSIRSPGAHPPVIQQGRWYPATAQSAGTSSFTIDVNAVANVLRDFYGLYSSGASNRIPIKLRFRWIKAWQVVQPTSGSTVRMTPIYIQCNSLVDATTTQNDLYTAYDYPAKNQFARVGFRWPSPHNKTVFDDSMTTVNICKIVVETGGAFVWQIGVWWRPDNGGPSLERLLFPSQSTDEPEGDPSSPFTSMQIMA